MSEELEINLYAGEAAHLGEDMATRLHAKSDLSPARRSGARRRGRNIQQTMTESGSLAIGSLLPL